MKLRLLGTALVTAMLSGCAGAGVTPPPAESRVDVDTPELRQAKAGARIAACPTGLEGSSDLPGASLACLGGGEPVPLDELPGPAVLPLWASWCEPCKDELPLYGRLAREADDRFTVLGVNYQDTQPGLAIDLLRQSRARFPQVADPAGVLAETYRIRGLPGVIWVTEDGTATFANDQVHSYADLTALVAEELDIAVTEPTGAAG